MDFTLLYSETRKQVLVLLLVPSLITSVMVVILVAGPDWEDWQIASLIIGVLIAAIAATIYAVRRQAQVPCRVQVTPSHFILRLERETWLYKEPELTVPWSALSNVDDEEYNGALYTNFKVAEPRRKFILAPVTRKDPAEYTRFLDALKNTVRAHNVQAAVQGAALITRKSFFDTAAARVLAWGLIGVLAVVVVGYLAGGMEGEFPFFRLVQISVFGIPFIIRVLARRKTFDKAKE